MSSRLKIKCEEKDGGNHVFASETLKIQLAKQLKLWYVYSTDPKLYNEFYHAQCKILVNGKKANQYINDHKDTVGMVIVSHRLGEVC